MFGWSSGLPEIPPNALLYSIKSYIFSFRLKEVYHLMSNNGCGECTHYFCDLLSWL